MVNLSNMKSDMSNKNMSEKIWVDKGNSIYMPHQSAIEGYEISFRYGSKKKRDILNGVNINVNTGTIYGLLGPSGCGKTTLLKCIIGRLKPNEGRLRIYGKRPGDSALCIPGKGIGYMPQELALYGDITVKEALTYFGSLYFMTKRELKDRITFLLEFLEIPNKFALIKNLSGGQKRRVSFACALIHQPPLLVLDEPTVGVDPLLRCSIWEHLKQLTETNHMTIIITTHYVEEARKADKVGFMRDGYILSEMNPEILMQRYEAESLEEVFWKLCKEDKFVPPETEKNKHGASYGNGFSLRKLSEKCKGEYEELRLMKYGVTIDENKEKEDTTYPPLNYRNQNDQVANAFESSPSSFMQSVIKTTAMMKKSFTCFRRNKLFSLFQVVVPAFQVIIFCICIGHEPFDLKFAVVNNETSIFGASQMFLDTLSNETFTKIPYNDLSDALQSVKSGQSWGAMYIGPRFSTALQDRILEGNNVGNQTIIDSTIRLHLDLSNQQIAYTIYAKIIQAFQVFAKKMLVKIYENPYLSESPVSIEDPVYGQTEPRFSDFIAPGIILGVTHFYAIGLTILSIVQEKKDGMLDRFWIAGVSAAEMITAVLAVLFTTMVAQIILVLISSIYVFDLTILGSKFGLFVLVLLAGTSGMAYGLFISTICSNEVEAVFTTLGSFYPIFLFSGMIWPIEGMPYYLRYFSYCIPLTTLGDTMRSLMLRGWSLTDYYMWVGCAVPLAWTIICVILACVLLKYSLSK